MPQEPARIPQLDGLRGIAILLILFRHYLGSPHQIPILSEVANLCFAGVDLFFVLSGFLIGGIVLKYCDAGNFYRVFYARRTLRIFPLYYALLAVYVVVHAWSDEAPPAIVGIYALYLQNIYSAFRGDFGPFWLGPTWSLAIEEHFYILLPLVVMITPRRYLLTVLLVGMAAATALRIAGYCGLAEFPALFAYFFTLCRADTLLLGVVLAYLARGPKHAALLQHKRWFSTALIVLAIAFVVVTAADREFSDSRALFVVGLPVLAALSASALVLAVWHERSWVSIVTRNGLLRWFGIRAYGLYLLHLPILDTCSRYLINRIPLPPELVALPITIGAAAILWRFVERPAIDYGHRFRYASLPTLRPQPEST